MTTTNPNDWPYPGSRWWKFDFHTHTPASKDTHAWRNAAGTADEITPQSWLMRYMQAGIDCVVVTDHNSGEWIDLLKSAYAHMQAQAAKGAAPPGFRALQVFPGVEISVHGGFHLLAIFDTSATTGDIDTLLGQVDYAGTKGDSDGVTRKGAAQVVEAVLAAGALAVPAHADGPKGLLQVAPGTRRCSLDTNSVKQVLEAEGVLAMEWCDLAAATPVEFDRLKPRWARVLGSDTHSFRGPRTPGSAFTWVKMAAATLEGLRLALLDGNGISVRRSDEGPFDPWRTPDHFISRIEISNARFMGSGNTPEVLPLTPFYNALIGGRGTGKSTIVHALRLACRRNEEVKRLSNEAEPRRQFERFCLVSRGRDGEGALRDDTEIRVELMHEGLLHRLRWRTDGQGHVVEVQAPGGSWTASPSQAVTAERFPIRLLSQGQIAALAGENRQALLDVVDEAGGAAPLHRALEEAKHTYLAQRARLREVEGRLQGRAEVERKLADLNRKLEAFTASHHTDLLRAHQRAVRQQREVDTLLEQLAAMPQRIEALAKDLVLDDWPAGVFDPTQDGEAIAWRTDVEAHLTEAREALAEVSRSLAMSEQAALASPALAAWRSRCNAAQEAHESLKATLAQQGVQDPQAFGRMVQERQQLELQLREFAKLEQDRHSLSVSSESQWRRVLDARQAITQARATFLSGNLQGNTFVRMSVEPFGYDVRVIERSLRALLEVTDDRFEGDILQLEGGESASGLAHDLAQGHGQPAALDAVKARLLAPDFAFGGRFRNYLLRKLERPEFADQVRCWFPDDDLRIEYSRGGNGKDFMSIAQGSPGQRAAALLAFLLAFGNEPLVLDQPEDDLDNHLIYELIVRQIRENKLRRQLIIVTHNSNVVVNGDAELVHAFDFRREQCYVKHRGALQEPQLRDEVCHVMEGGRDAFAARWARLGREF